MSKIHLRKTPSTTYCFISTLAVTTTDKPEKVTCKGCLKKLNEPKDKRFDDDHFTAIR